MLVFPTYNAIFLFPMFKSVLIKKRRFNLLLDVLFSS